METCSRDTTLCVVVKDLLPGGIVSGAMYVYF